VIALFSYGTLQQPQVQLTNYGRLVDGTADALIGTASNRWRSTIPTWYG
jgi:hypothetical protein